jgi:hypothetical protein
LPSESVATIAKEIALTAGRLCSDESKARIQMTHETAVAIAIAAHVVYALLTRR